MNDCDQSAEIERLRSELKAIRKSLWWRNWLGAAVATVVSLAAVSAPVSAKSKRGLYTVYGEGLVSGGGFSSLIRLALGNQVDSWEDALAAKSYGAWVNGYLSAANCHLPDTLNLRASTDAKGVMAWIAKYGENHPTENLCEATQALVFHLYPRRGRAEPAD